MSLKVRWIFRMFLNSDKIYRTFLFIHAQNCRTFKPFICHKHYRNSQRFRVICF
ncbi:hypothetical protein HMPREF9065_01423 [Aggregatibacter sp. oral taxon 458 str. W10330]|nr:hypothetical protein HMPREF9065_01423 [Aggregatibacter sp. oral taxon 458 str. W10330]